MAAHDSDEAQVTTDHDEIRKWAEARGGKPAAVKATHRGKDAGILRLMFPKVPRHNDEALEEISWDEFFEKFDKAGLALLYQDTRASGEESLFNKLIDRGTAEKDNGRGGASKPRR
jgi:hypothetical protein